VETLKPVTSRGKLEKNQMPKITKTRTGFNVQHTTREVWGVDDNDARVDLELEVCTLADLIEACQAIHTATNAQPRHQVHPSEIRTSRFWSLPIRCRLTALAEMAGAQ
jgi:hypothetical protein